MLRKELQKALDGFMDEAYPETQNTGDLGGSDPEVVKFTDYYHEGSKNRLKMAQKPISHGSSPHTAIAMRATVENLRPRYAKAKDDSESLKLAGDTVRSDMMREQYMDEQFLPAVETLVQLYGADDVLANQSVLSELDKLTLVNGSGSGYTKAFILALHPDDLRSQQSLSDGFVIKALRDINGLVAQNQIRSAIAVAKRIKESIDNGENAASPDDYDIIQRVALRG